MNTRFIPPRIELYPFAANINSIECVNAIPHGIVVGECDALEAEACRDALRAQQRGEEVCLGVADARPVLKDVGGPCCNHCSAAVEGMGYLVAYEFEGNPGFFNIAHAVRKQLGG